MSNSGDGEALKNGKENKQVELATKVAISLQSIGRVECAVSTTAAKMPSGWPAVIRVDAEYSPALHRIGEYSHLWIMCWFHESNRELLQLRPSRMSASLPEYGVFALRSPVRPNPISLTVVKLEKVENNLLYVTGLDAIDGTAVLDIKPYFAADLVFAAKSPYMPAIEQLRQKEMFTKIALNHHGEECAGLQLGVRMALCAEKIFGEIQSDDLCLTVKGAACLADVLQGLTRARLANPPRFLYLGEQSENVVLWCDKNKIVTMKVLKKFAELTQQELTELNDAELFSVI